jgi:hypothetical protein
MKKGLGIAMALLLVCAVSGAWAEEITGKIMSVDQTERALVLDDGTRLWVAEGLSVDMLREGVSVKASYEERDGKKVVTGFHIAE